MRNAPLQPTDIHIFAANGTPIPVMGTVTLGFQVDGVPTNCNFLVSDAVDEPMLGIDWLQENNCHWDFVRQQVGACMCRNTCWSLLWRRWTSFPVGVDRI